MVNWHFYVFLPKINNIYPGRTVENPVNEYSLKPVDLHANNIKIQLCNCRSVGLCQPTDQEQLTLAEKMNGPGPSCFSKEVDIQNILQELSPGPQSNVKKIVKRKTGGYMMF